jgi:hypothetical protein
MNVRQLSLVCTAILALGTAAAAGERKVPGSYSTIQAAVDAAVSGDVVVCAAGTYTEAVTATKSNITIAGAAGAIWDGKTGTAAVTCVNLTGNANVVSGFTFKNGIDHVVLTGDDCKVKNNHSQDARNCFTRVKGARGRVDNCKAERTGGDAVVVEGDASVVIDVVVDVCAGIGIDVKGDDCKTHYSKVTKCDNNGVRKRGKRCELKFCDAYQCKPSGFHCETDDAYCYSNWAEDCGTTGGAGAGFRFVGNANFFKYCDTWECKPHGHHCEGDYNWWYDNWSDWCEEDGFRCEGNDNDCEYNRSQDCGRDGHGTRGDRNRHYSCEAYDNGDDGFDCDGGSDNEYRYCKGKYNDGAGCENGGVETDAYACVFLYNTIDIGLDGTLGASWDLFSLNTFLSGSLTGILKIGLGL